MVISKTIVLVSFILIFFVNSQTTNFTNLIDDFKYGISKDCSCLLKVINTIPQNVQSILKKSYDDNTDVDRCFNMNYAEEIKSEYLKFLSQENEKNGKIFQQKKKPLSYCAKAKDQFNTNATEIVDINQTISDS